MVPFLTRHASIMLCLFAAAGMGRVCLADGLDDWQADVATELGVEATSNLHRREDGEGAADIYVTASLAAQFDSAETGDRESFSIASRHRKHAQNGADDYWQAALTGLVERKISSEGLVGFDVGIERSAESRGGIDQPSSSSGPTLFRIWQTGASWRRTDRRGEEALSARLSFNDYDDTARQDGGVINQDDRDHWSASIRGSFRRQISRTLDARLSMIANRISYVSVEDEVRARRNSTGGTVLLGIDWRLDRRFDASLLAGWLYRSYDDRRFKSVQGPTIGAEVAWQVDRRLRVVGEFGRELKETTVSGASLRSSWQASTGVTYDLERRWRLSATVKGSTDLFPGTPRRDRSIAGDVVARYEISRNSGVSFRLQSDRRLAGEGGTDYDRNRFGVLWDYTL